MKRPVSLVSLLAVLAFAASALALAGQRELGARRGAAKKPPVLRKGDYVITFSGTGHGMYSYNTPEVDGVGFVGGGGCQQGEHTFKENDDYNWKFTFETSPTGTPLSGGITVTGGGLTGSSFQVGACGSSPASMNSCSGRFQPPTGDSLPYPTLEVAIEHGMTRVTVSGGLTIDTLSLESGCAGTYDPNPGKFYDVGLIAFADGAVPGSG